MKSGMFDKTCYSLYPLAERTDGCWHFLLIAAAICWVIGVILWITVAEVVSNPPNGSEWTSCLVTIHTSTPFQLSYMT